VENTCAKHPKKPLEGEWFIVPIFHLKQEQKNIQRKTPTALTKFLGQNDHKHFLA